MQTFKIKDLFKNKTFNTGSYAKYLALMPDIRQEKARKFTTIVLTLGASIMLGLFAISPTLSTIANLQKQITDNTFVEAKLQQKINDLTVLHQKYADIQNDLPVIYNAIPKTAEITPLIGAIQTIANDSNVTLEGLQTYQVDLSQATTLVKPYSSFDFGLTATGNYNDMKTFINKLIDFQRITTISDISISKTDINNTSVLELNIKGTVFFKE